MRETHPERYAELAGKLIMTSEPRPDSIETAQSFEELALRLLRQVGLDAPDDASIAEAIEANNQFIAQLEAIRDRAQGGLN